MHAAAARSRALVGRVRRIVHDFYVAHPSIKRSPIKSDILKIKDEHSVNARPPKTITVCMNHKLHFFPHPESMLDHHFYIKAA